ncbi:hypothetical protein D3C71_1200380 [compost metagenome]
METKKTSFTEKISNGFLVLAVFNYFASFTVFVGTEDTNHILFRSAVAAIVAIALKYKK